MRLYYFHAQGTGIMTDDSQIYPFSQKAKKEANVLELQSVEYNHQIFMCVWRYKYMYVQNEHLMKADLWTCTETTHVWWQPGVSFIIIIMWKHQRKYSQTFLPTSFMHNLDMWYFKANKNCWWATSDVKVCYLLPSSNALHLW